MAKKKTKKVEEVETSWFSAAAEEVPEEVVEETPEEVVEEASFETADFSTLSLPNSASEYKQAPLYPGKNTDQVRGILIDEGTI